MGTEEDIVVIYVNLINMVAVFTNTPMDFIFSYETIAREKKIKEILRFCKRMANANLLKGNWLLVNPLPNFSFKFTLPFALTDPRSNWISSSVKQNSFVTNDIVLYLFDRCLLLSFAFIKHTFNVEYF